MVNVMHGMILKFTDQQYVESVRNGSIHLSNIKYFWNYEEGEQDGIKDKHEGKIIRELNPDTTVLYARPLGSDIPPIRLGKLTKAVFQVGYTLADQIAIASFVALDFDTDFNRTKDNKLILKQDVFDELKKNFAGRPAIVMQAGTFQQMLNEIKLEPRFKIEVQHLIKQTNLHKKVMKTYSC